MVRGVGVHLRPEEGSRGPLAPHVCFAGHLSDQKLAQPPRVGFGRLAKGTLDGRPQSPNFISDVILDKLSTRAIYLVWILWFRVRSPLLLSIFPLLGLLS
jgi:hypothetical protein